MSMKFEAWLIAGCLLALVVFGIAYLGVFPQFAITSTRYAPGFSQSAWAKVKLGATAEDVQRSLGHPLRIATNSVGKVFWYYSLHRHPENNWVLCWDFRVITLSNSFVTEKVQQIMRD